MAIVFPQWYDQVILDKEGLPAASGNVNAFYAGTQTPAPTYNDNNQANPLDISIDSAGRVEMKLDDSIVYDIYMYDIEGALIKTRPGVIGGGASSGGDGVQSVTSGNDGIFVDNSDPDNPKIENAKPETFTVLSNTSDTVPGMLATKIVSTDGSVDVGTSADATDGVRIDLSVDAVEEAPLTGEIYGRESGTWAETRTKASIDGTDVESFTSTGAQGDQTLSIKRSNGSEETVDILIAVTDETLSGSGTSASPLSVSGIMDRVTSLNASTGVTDSWVKIVDIDMGEDSQASLNLKLKSDSLTELNSAKIKIVQDQSSWSVSLQECLTSNSDGSPWIASTSPVQFSTSGSVISIWIGYYYVSSARFIDYVQWGKPYELMNVNSVTEYDGAVWTTSAPSTTRVSPNEVQIIEYAGASTLFDGLLTANGGISTTDIDVSGALNVSGLSTVAGVVANGNIVPDTTDFQNLGSVTNRWQNLHALLGSFTGPLTASGGISTTDIDVSGDLGVGGAGAFGQTVGINNSSGVRRFNLGYDPTPDDFVITSRDDAGSYRDTPISIGRNTSDAVTVNRALTVAGAIAVGTNATIENGFLQLTRTSGANGIIINETGAANPSLLVTTQGRMRWGDPSTAADTELYRDAANSLYTP
ncbi:MAG: hypothetical protein D4S01_01555, partial [Dehalococcoidia bacterium]